MAPANYIEKVAIVGASGRIGSHFVEELLKTGKHSVTIITRPDSKGDFPDGAKVERVDFDDEPSLVAALKGQQFFIITLSVLAPADTHSKLVKAAASAGVPWIMPNIYGGDYENEKLASEDLFGSTSIQKVNEIKDFGVSSFIAMACGLWYEWSLALGEPFFGFDIKNRTVTFIDDGNTKVNASTWKQCGRALAGLLSLPIEGGSSSVADWRNKLLYFDSFTITQRDILDSLHRVIGTTDGDWTITYEESSPRYKRGIEAMQKGERMGFVTAMYTRNFYPNGGGDYGSTRGLSNEVLNLPEEDLDEATKRTVKMVESGWNPFGA